MVLFYSTADQNNHIGPKFSTVLDLRIVKKNRKKVSKNDHCAPTVQFSTALVRTAMFLTALYPREFGRSTEAGKNKICIFMMKKRLTSTNQSVHFFVKHSSNHSITLKHSHRQKDNHTHSPTRKKNRGDV